MGKFYGTIGFVKTEQNLNSPGVYKEVVTEKKYYGEIIQNTNKRWQSNENSINDNINIDNRISIICDIYALENLSHIRFVEVYGSPWNVTSVEINHPRMILSIGGVYNGERQSKTDSA